MGVIIYVLGTQHHLGDPRVGGVATSIVHRAIRHHPDLCLLDGNALAYESFERTVLLGVIGALVASVGILALLNSFTIVSLTIQLLVAFVALATTRYGRRGGSASALVASVIYVLVQGQASSVSLTASPSPFVMLWPIAAFGLVGIAGGQILTMLKYDRARFTAADALDEYSRLYNQRHFSELLTSALERFGDSGSGCCVVTLQVSYSLHEDRPSRHRAVVRSVAQQIISGVRLIDDCARFDDGSYAVLLWGCRANHGHAVADRLAGAIKRQLRAEHAVVSSSVLALPDDESRLSRLLESSRPDAEDYSLASGA